MTPENFCYWLQGHYELLGEKCLTDKDLIIRDHLALVFRKETPMRTCVPPAPLIKRDGPFSSPLESIRLCSTQVGQCSTESPYPVDQVAVASFRDINNEPSC